MKNSGAIRKTIGVLTACGMGLQSQAGENWTTKSKCSHGWQYYAEAHCGCGALLEHVAVQLNCAAAAASSSCSCLFGSASSSSHANASGQGGSHTRHGTGWAGSPGTTNAPTNSVCSSDITSLTVFDSTTRHVTLTINQATLAVTTNGAVTQFYVILWQEAYGGDPTPTPYKTLYSGGVQLLNSTATSTIGNFPVTATNLEGTGASMITISNLVVDLPVPAGADFDLLAVTVQADSGQDAVTPPALATFDQPPTTQTVTVGQTATFTQVSEGDGPLSYVWQQGTNVLGTDPSLSISNVTMASALTGLVCIISNSFSSVTSPPVSLIVLPAVAGCVPPPANMVAWWPMDETSGTTVADISGNGLNGTASPGPIGPVATINGPTPINGEVRGGLYFWHQYDNRYIDVPNSPALTFATNDFSIDAWVWINQYSGPTELQPIVEKMQYSGTTPMQGYRFYLASGVLTFQVAVAGVVTTTAATTQVSQGVWHLVAVTYQRPSGGNQPVVLYIDGAPAESTSLPSVGNFGNSTTDLIIGGSILGSAINYLNIDIDEVEMFNAALAQQDIQNIFNAGSAGKCKPVCYTGITVTCPANKTVQAGSNWTFDPPAGSSCCGSNVTVAVTGTVTNGVANITFTGGGTAANGVVDFSGDTAISGYLDITAGTNAGSYTLSPGAGTNTYFNWDNLVFPTSDPFLDSTGGLLFTNSGLEINFWGNGPGSYSLLGAPPKYGPYVTNGVATIAVSSQTITRTWLLTDACGNSNTCSQTVTVASANCMTVTCPTAKTVQSGSGWTFDLPVASSCCGSNVTVAVTGTVTNGVANITFSGGGTAANGVVDFSGDIATGGHLDITAGTNAGSYTLSPGAGTNTYFNWDNLVFPTSDPFLDSTGGLLFTNGGLEINFWGNGPGSYSLLGAPPKYGPYVTNGVATIAVSSQTITRTWLLTDACGNSNTCSQTVTVVNGTPPVLTCATNKTVQCGTVWSFDAPTASGGCSGSNMAVTVAGTVTNGVCPQLITRTWLATDACGNSNTCSQTVTVVDTNPPVIACAGDVTVGSGQAWSFTPPTASDACCGNPAITVLSTVTNASNPGAISYTRTWQATDCCGNAATCSQTVTVESAGAAYGLVALTNVWRYDQSGSDYGAIWRSAAYDDSAWQQGAAFFGVYSNTPYPYPVPIQTPLTLGGGRITYYFRTHFNFPPNTVGFALVASNYVDDGAVFYLNGTEVGRLRMSAGVVGFQSPAASAAPGGPVQVLTFASGSLVQGDNVLAVEVHQTTATNADVLFGMSLTAIIETNLAHKILVNSADTSTTSQLAASGAANLANYPSFSLWSVSATQAPPSLLSAPSVTIRYDFDAVPIRGGLQISAQTGPPGIPANLTEVRTANGSQFWIVQYAGPIQNAWVSELTNTGVQVVWYTPANAYIVWGNSQSLTNLDNLAAQRRYIIGDYAYHPHYRLEASLQQAASSQPSNQMVNVTVQVYNSTNVNQTLANLGSFGGQVWLQPSSLQSLSSISLQLPAGQLIAVANWNDVYNLEPWIAPTASDEVQGQIVAGNVVSSGANIVPQPTSAATYTPYRLWLISKGFRLDQAAYPIVDVVDDGIDNGDAANPLHPDFWAFGTTTPNALIGAPVSRIAYIGNVTSDPAGNGVRGHGNLNAGIVAAYDRVTPPLSPYSIDGKGYNIGMGISPFGRVAGTKFLNIAGNGDWSGLPTANQNFSGVVGYIFNEGANLTSDSWGQGSSYGAYNTYAQSYDGLTRNASSSSPAALHEMLDVFAAGNDGAYNEFSRPAYTTIESPGSAKNVLTVGATENVRDGGVLDGCNWTKSGNADNVAPFSSRGPCADGRLKPDVMAPGMHIQGLASQDPNYTAAGICGNKYAPAGQTWYTEADGTSQATPAIAGAVSLIYENYPNLLYLSPNGGNPTTPSPAMLKALVINSTRYLGSGNYASDPLPSDNFGWGDIDLGLAFDGTPRILVDQTTVFTASLGASYSAAASVYDATKPVRVTLVWSDAPGNTTGNAWVNDLDLQVTVGSTTYIGNVFSGQYAPLGGGGTADHMNNVECVFLAPNTTGPITVTVTPINIVPGATGFSPGIPGNPNPASQDFALVIYNAVQTVTPRADVFIRDFPNSSTMPPNVYMDIGTEPDPPIQNGWVNDYWESPDIWNRTTSPTLDDGTTPIGYEAPVFEQDNWVNVHLWNSGPYGTAGVAASGVVKLYWANGSSALTWPDDWNWFADIPVNASSPWKNIGTGGLQAGEDTIVNALWHPPGAGHYCVTAMWVSGQDPLGSPLTSDVTSNTRNNNNVAWRNMEVSAPSAGPIVYEFIMRNPATNAVVYNMFLGARLTTNSDTFLNHGEVFFDLGSTLYERWSQAGAQGTGFHVVTNQFGTVFQLLNAAGASINGIELNPGEEETVTYYFLSETNTVGTFPVVAVQMLGTNTVGGMTYIINTGPVTNCVNSPSCCLSLSQERLVPVPGTGYYDYTFKVNNTHFPPVPIEYLMLVQDPAPPPDCVSFDPDILPLWTLAPGASVVETVHVSIGHACKGPYCFLVGSVDGNPCTNQCCSIAHCLPPVSYPIRFTNGFDGSVFPTGPITVPLVLDTTYIQPSVILLYAGSNVIYSATNTVTNSTILSVTWSNVVPGAYTLSAEVIDKLGGEWFSAPAAVTVAQGLLKLTPLKYANNAFTFSLATTAGVTYQVQSTGSLSPSQWTVLQTLVGDGSTVTVTNAPAAAKQQFYRVLVEQ